jgi:membrane associated rhomboid family serine protease
MLVVIPIRTESVVRRTPSVNYLLIAANVFLFLLFDIALPGESISAFKTQHLAFHSQEPAIHEFFTYQFLHADILHLLGNMLFLWVFGNSVNSKMGDGPYLLFYLAGGAFAAWGYALMKPFPLIGASGAIAAVTTAYLVLFPRSHITVLVWLFIFIQFFELPAIVMIGLKIIVWDNLVAPILPGGKDAVAHSAHLAGYVFGFVSALGMLLVRALPRDQFDLLAVWGRWHKRRELAAAMAESSSAARARGGPASVSGSFQPYPQAAEPGRLDEVAGLREQISERLEQRDVAGAVVLYERLVAVDSRQCLSERQQIEVAREFYRTERFSRAASAFERFVESYPGSADAGEIRLLLGIIYARDLKQYEAADKHLTQSMRTLREQARREQCLWWLRSVRAALGLAAPEG